MESKLTAERVRELLRYDPCTGIFHWRKSLSNRTPVGSVAGALSVTSKGMRYIRIKLDGEKHGAHRLAWLYITGAWPRAFVDHIDGDGTNNAFGNLREASPSQNAFNTRPRDSSTSGVAGVTYDQSRGQWRAEITAHGNVKVLGMFDDMALAINARRAAEPKHHGPFAFGCRNHPG